MCGGFRRAIIPRLYFVNERFSRKARVYKHNNIMNVWKCINWTVACTCWSKSEYCVMSMIPFPYTVSVILWTSFRLSITSTHQKINNAWHCKIILLWLYSLWCFVWCIYQVVLKYLVLSPILCMSSACMNNTIVMDAYH